MLHSTMLTKNCTMGVSTKTVSWTECFWENQKMKCRHVIKKHGDGLTFETFFAVFSVTFRSSVFSLQEFLSPLIYFLYFE